MELEKLSPRYAIRQLDLSDAETVLHLYQGNPQYFEHMHDMPTLASTQSDLTALPPGKNRDDKHYLGFYDGEELIAVMDLIEGFPTPDTAFIGLFMVRGERQGKGLGRQLITDALAALAKTGFAHVRLGYVETNAQSRSFWYACGFQPTGVISKQEAYSVVIMQKEIGK